MPIARGTCDIFLNNISFDKGTMQEAFMGVEPAICEFSLSCQYLSNNFQYARSRETLTMRSTMSTAARPRLPAATTRMIRILRVDGRALARMVNLATLPSFALSMTRTSRLATTWTSTRRN